jgi:hypothetical protein
MDIYNISYRIWVNRNVTVSTGEIQSYLFAKLRSVIQHRSILAGKIFLPCAGFICRYEYDCLTDRPLSL